MFLAYDSGKTVTNFINLLMQFFKNIISLIKDIYIRDSNNYVITYFNIIIAVIIISAFLSIFFKGAKG